MSYIQRQKNERLELQKRNKVLSDEERALKLQILKQEALKQEKIRSINEEREKTLKKLEEDKLKNTQLEKEYKTYEQSQTAYGKVKSKLGGIVKEISSRRSTKSVNTGSKTLNTSKAQSGLNRLGGINRGSTGLQLGSGGVQQSPFNMPSKGSPFNMGKRKGGSLF